jgi:hypothetical protein
LVVLGAIDQKHGGFDIVFLTKFSEKDLCECGRCRRKQPQMEQFVCLGIGSSVQPELPIVNSNHRFVNRNVIRILAICGL